MTTQTSSIEIYGPNTYGPWIVDEVYEVFGRTQDEAVECARERFGIDGTTVEGWSAFPKTRTCGSCGAWFTIEDHFDGCEVTS